MHLFPVSLVLLLSWGALAIGGSPTWAATSVAVLAVSTGLLGILESAGRPSHTNPDHRRALIALAIVVGAIGLQLTPLPEGLIARLSPARSVVNFEKLLATADNRDPEMVAVIAPGESRPITIAPQRTWIGLGFLVSLAVLLIGSTRGLSGTSATVLSRWICLLGVLVSLIGLHRQMTNSEAIFGLYVPFHADSLAPFINKNHQAGWLVMVLSLTLGAFAGELTRGMRNIAPDVRSRIVWLSSKDANVALLQLFASLVMAIAILSTRSRSGAIALFVALTTLALWGLRRQPSKATRRVMTVGLLAVMLIAVMTSGAGVIARLNQTDWSANDYRVRAWKDSWRILNDFWLTGTGFNTYGTAMLHYQTTQPQLRYIEAHNDYLQLAIEGGVLVGVPFAALAGCIAFAIYRRFQAHHDDTRTYWVRVGAIAGIAAIAVQAVVEFTLQMSGAAVMFATLLAIALHASPARTGASHRS